jgi:hypothetical protein
MMAKSPGRKKLSLCNPARKSWAAVSAKRSAKCAGAHEQADDKADAVPCGRLFHFYSNSEAKTHCRSELARDPPNIASKLAPTQIHL